MGVSINVRQAYSEIDEFLELISNEQKNKIPKKLRNFFREEKDANYIKKINSAMKIHKKKFLKKKNNKY